MLLSFVLSFRKYYILKRINLDVLCYLDIYTYMRYLTVISFRSIILYYIRPQIESEHIISITQQLYKNWFRRIYAIINYKTYSSKILVAFVSLKFCFASVSKSERLYPGYICVNNKDFAFALFATIPHS